MIQKLCTFDSCSFLKINYNLASQSSAEDKQDFTSSLINDSTTYHPIRNVIGYSRNDFADVALG